MKGGDMVIATVVLAAGGSSRMAGGHKLLEVIEGRTVVEWAVGAALAAALGPVLVVTGHRARDVAEVLPPETRVVENPDWASGMAGSLRLGAAALPDDVDAFAVALGDMPAVRIEHYRTLAGAWAPGNVVVPTHEGRPGHPVIWARAFARDMAELEGDRGARSILDRHNHAVIEVPIKDPGVVVDVDTREHLDDVRSLLAGDR